MRACAGGRAMMEIRLLSLPRLVRRRDTENCAKYLTPEIFLSNLSPYIAVVAQSHQSGCRRELKGCFRTHAA